MYETHVMHVRYTPAPFQTHLTTSTVPSPNPHSETVVRILMGVSECVIMHPGKTLQISPFQPI